MSTEFRRLLRNVGLISSAAMSLAGCASVDALNQAPKSYFKGFNGKDFQGIQEIINYCKGTAEATGKFGMELSEGVGLRIGDLSIVSIGRDRLSVYPPSPDRVKLLTPNSISIRTNNLQIPELTLTYSKPLISPNNTRFRVEAPCPTGDEQAINIVQY